jgi:hypothetical protein
MSSTMLKKLDISFGPCELYSMAEMDAIKGTFCDSASLESLRVVTGDSLVTEAILEGLKDGIANARYKLQELKIGPSNREDLIVWVALSEFTQATTHLKHLQIDDVEFDEMQMVAFLDCLNGPSSISKLSFRHCSMDSDAMRALTAFMGTSQDGSEVVLSSLRDLVMECEDYSGPQLASMLSMKGSSDDGQLSPGDKRTWCSTIGSNLNSLTMSYLRYGFLETLAQKGRRIRLARLSLPDLDYEDCMELARCISNLSSLQQLEMGALDDAHSVLCSLRRNGTLQSVSVFGETESRLASSYVLRNKLVGNLVQDIASVETDSPIGTTDRSKGGRECKSLYPTLLQSAKQISRSRLSSALYSLLGLHDSIGPV